MSGAPNGETAPGGDGFVNAVVDGVAEAEVGTATPENPAEAAAEESSADGPLIDGADDVGTEDAGTEGAGAAAPAGMSVEVLIADLERVTAERDQYLDTSRRVQAEFENYRKQVAKREADARERANEGMVNEMLPVLDAFDGALTSGLEDLAPMQATLLDALTKQGLERIAPAGGTDAPEAFDPNLHEAVMHEDGEGAGGPVVAELLRVGYSWKGRVVRPAMVRVRG